MNSLSNTQTSSFQPFSKELNPADCFESSGVQEAMARLEIMIQHRYLGVLTGEVGGGKSTLIRRLFNQLNPMTYAPVYLCKRGLKPRDFYDSLLTQLGVEPSYSVAKSRQLWDDTLQSRITHKERMLVIVIDEAHEMNESMMDELRFVLNYNMDSCSLFPLILVGQPDLRRILRLKKHEATAQRVGMQYHLAVMSKEETFAYIRHHLRVGQIERPLFADGAMQRIHAASQGLPRVINLICAQALLDAVAKNLEVIEESHIVKILADMDRQRGISG
jgi:type II secretory pathway predicted ATPase ExeA